MIILFYLFRGWHSFLFICEIKFQFFLIFLLTILNDIFRFSYLLIVTCSWHYPLRIIILTWIILFYSFFFFQVRTHWSLRILIRCLKFAHSIITVPFLYTLVTSCCSNYTYLVINLVLLIRTWFFSFIIFDLFLSAFTAY